MATPVRGCNNHSVAADGHQRMTREFAKLIFTECFAVDQRPAINPAVRNCLAQMRQKAKVLVNAAFRVS